MYVVTVANLKGGSAKTTTTAFLAHAWAAQGRNVLVVDADPQGSALRWSELGEWTLPTLGLAVRDLHRRLPGIVGDRHDVVVIDTPPLDDQTGIVYSAMRAATHVVVPMAPTMIELDRLPEVWAALDEVAALRQEPPQAAVLLTRTVPNASSTKAIRDAVEGTGQRVLNATVPRRELYGQAYGRPALEDAGGGAYTAAAAEILGAGPAAGTTTEEGR